MCVYVYTRARRKLSQMKKREKEVEAFLKNEIRKLGGLLLKFVSPGNDGVPDRIAIMPDGRVWFIEFKAEGGDLRPLQEYWRVTLLDKQQQVAVIRGMDEARDFAAWLRTEYKGAVWETAHRIREFMEGET